jgi:hypothetical protein
VRESDFRPLDGSVKRSSKDASGFFEFVPSEKLDLDLVERLLLVARDEVDSVDVVLLPECAVEETEVSALAGCGKTMARPKMLSAFRDCCD